MYRKVGVIALGCSSSSQSYQGSYSTQIKQGLTKVGDAVLMDYPNAKITCIHALSPAMVCNDRACRAEKL